MTKETEKWQSVDWTLQDVVIADQMGLSRQAVFMQRKICAKGIQATEKNRKRPAKESVNVLRTIATENGLLTREELFHRYNAMGHKKNIALMSVYHKCKEFSIPCKRFGFDWDSADWTKPNRVLAKEIGYATTTVAQMRHEQKRPKATEKMGSWLNKKTSKP